MIPIHDICMSVMPVICDNVTVTLTRNVGYTIVDCQQVPTAELPVSIIARVQEVTNAEIALLDGLGISGESIAIYLSGVAKGTVRAGQNDGDLIELPTGEIYRITAISEQWHNIWVKVLATKQL